MTALRSPWSSIDGVSPLSEPIDDFQENDMRDKMDILGEQVLNEMRSTVGFDFGALVNAAAGVAKTAVDQSAASKAADKAKSDAAAALTKAVDADAQWANAEANLDLAKKDPAESARLWKVRDKLRAEAQAAGSVLGPEAAQKRCKVANDAMESAMSAARNAPKDIAKQAKSYAWQQVAPACGGPLMTLDKPAEGAIGPASSGQSWITVKRAGLPTWGWGLVGVGGLGALVLIIRALGSKK